MWLLPFLAPFSRFVVRVYYRFRVVGSAVPEEGPLLLVANHPNALLDPAMVVAAAGRPVRFLAKSTLFEDRRIGWLIRAGGGIPVFRRSDGPVDEAANVDAFRAARRALTDGFALGIFPEGTSHSEPSLSRLKTGSARIALGASRDLKAPFPIVPVGLELRKKQAFRSTAAAVLGEPIEWHDLAGRQPEDAEAVRELNERLETGLRRVTINLERREDRPLIDWAEAIWSAENPDTRHPRLKLERISAAAAILAQLRRAGDPGWSDLAAQIQAHRERLRHLGLQPVDLTVEPTLSHAMRWAVRRVHLLGPPALLIAIAASLLFWLPYRTTELAVRRATREPEDRSTYAVLLGAVIYLLWIVVLTIVAGRMAGPWAALAALVAVPAIGLTGLRVRDRWGRALSEIGRFLRLRSRRRFTEHLRQEQLRLAARLEELYRAWQRGELPEDGLPFPTGDSAPDSADA